MTKFTFTVSKENLVKIFMNEEEIKNQPRWIDGEEWTKEEATQWAQDMCNQLDPNVENEFFPGDSREKPRLTQADIDEIDAITKAAAESNLEMPENLD